MRVRALKDCFVGTYHKAGEEFEYTGPKNANLQAVKPEKLSSGTIKEDEKEK